jgi:CDP-glucose 4,6-dehydratase
MRTMFDGKRTLVTGASGFKGAWLCAILHELGAHVYAAVRPGEEDPDSVFSLLKMRDRVETVSIDLEDDRSVERHILAIRPDYCFHLAAKGVVQDCLDAPMLACQVNVLGTIRLLEACRKYGVCERFLAVSTDHVFGALRSGEAESRVPFDETAPVGGGGIYEVSKSTMEQWVRCFDETYGGTDGKAPLLGITRAVNVFGPGDYSERKRRVIPAFIRQGLHDGVIRPRALRNARQFIHVTDVLSGYILALANLEDVRRGWLDATGSVTPVFHFSHSAYPDIDGRFIRIAALATFIANRTGARVDVEGVADFAPHQNTIQGLDCTWTKRMLDWEPARDFSESLDELILWYDPKLSRRERASRIDSLVQATARRLRDRLAV